MSDQGKTEKPALTLVPQEQRRDWGDAGPAIAQTINTAMEKGERILIIYMASDGQGGVQCSHNVFTRHSPRVSWLEFLMVLQARMTEWTVKLFSGKDPTQ